MLVCISYYGSDQVVLEGSGHFGNLELPLFLFFKLLFSVLILALHVGNISAVAIFTQVVFSGRLYRSLIYRCALSIISIKL